MLSRQIENALVVTALEFMSLSNVRSVVLGGSLANGHSDTCSDADIYVYADGMVSFDERLAIATRLGSEPEVGNCFWEDGDEWISTTGKIRFDITFRDVDWITTRLDRVLKRDEASLGYSTTLWRNVRSARILDDSFGWYARLQQSCNVRYPETLRSAIIRKNYSVLRCAHSSYVYQLKDAIKRDDSICVHHRVTALLASYFDILFALNRQPHPGEKRIVAYCIEECKKVPDDLQSNVESVLSAAGCDHGQLLREVTTLLDGLDKLLVSCGMDAGQSHAHLK